MVVKDVKSTPNVDPNAISLVAQVLKDGKIDADESKKIIDFYMNAKPSTAKWMERKITHFKGSFPNRSNFDDAMKVKKSGLFGLLGDQAKASDILGPGGIGTGLNDAIGGINGAAAMGDAYGVGGLAARGGGGGTGLGVGGLGGHGTGRGRGGNGEFDLGGTGRGSGPYVPASNSGTQVKGGLKAEEVGRVIRRHWNEIKYVYEKELGRDPEIYGKVKVSFQINAQGKVENAKITEIDDSLKSNVAEGTLDNIKNGMLANVTRWTFPEPRGGGTVDVNYPFIFSSGR